MVEHALRTAKLVVVACPAIVQITQSNLTSISSMSCLPIQDLQTKLEMIKSLNRYNALQEIYKQKRWIGF